MSAGGLVEGLFSCPVLMVSGLLLPTFLSFQLKLGVGGVVSRCSCCHCSANYGSCLIAPDYPYLLLWGRCR